jgi:fructose-bisphosphate aldolase, class II
MTLVPTADLVRAAQGAGHGVAAFNVIGLEHVEAVVAGAEAAGRPVLIQISQNAVAFRGGRLAPLAAACRVVADGSPVRVGLHLDHVEDERLARQAADQGCGSVMLDFSREPYSRNVDRTRELTEWAHGQGLWVEAELGEIGGKDGAHAPGVRTDPLQAREFVAATGVDGLAVAVGSSHAMTTRDARLDVALVSALRRAVPVPLVLHGSSGVPDLQLRQAVRAGIVKVNVGTALGLAFTGAVRAGLGGAGLGGAGLGGAGLGGEPAGGVGGGAVDPRRYLAPARTAMAEVVEAIVRVVSLEPADPEDLSDPEDLADPEDPAGVAGVEGR